MKSQKSAETAIRQLCALGFSSRVMVPRLIELLHQYLSFSSGVYFWFDETGNVNDIYDTRPDSYNYMPLYMTEFHNKLEREVFDGFSSWGKFRQVTKCDQIWKVDRKQLLKHSFYNEFLKNIGYYWCLHRALWKNGVCHGMIQVKRESGFKQFTDEEARRFENLCGFIEHGVGDSYISAERTSETPENVGFILVDANGRIQHISENAIKLSVLCTKEDITNVYKSFSKSTLPAMFKTLLSSLLDAQRGKAASPPSKTINNKWGQFVINVYRCIPSPVSNGSEIFQIQIEHREPFRMTLLKRLNSAELTYRQTQVSLEICTGKPYSTIADMLGISESSVVTHKKELFRRLGVSNRHQLSEKILSLS